ncbi:MAG TPA: carboxypeptidase regulatory-like domain-containing protein [Acidobacteriaceae bacterium]|jgi:hypothetical protein
MLYFALPSLPHSFAQLRKIAQVAAQLCLAAVFLCLSVRAGAQAASATLSGTVADATSAVLVKANVTVTNEATGVVTKTKTNSAGAYVIPSLAPGQYRIRVEHTGFKQIEVEHLELHVQDIVNRNFALPVGASSETIQVNGDSLNINTTDGSVSTVIDRQFVQNIPLNGRSFQDLILFIPGVVTQTPQTTGTVGNTGDFSVNGQRTESNTYIVDGVSGNTNAGYGTYGYNAGGNIPSSTALGTTQSLVSVDALQEFRVNSSTYSAEYGRTPGGQFSFVTRSGTDGFHGSVFDFLRNNYFDANNWFTNYLGAKGPALRQNDFGGTLGGPIRIPRLYNGKGRDFFFVSYEGLRLTQPQAASVQYVPSASLRSQAPAALQPILNAFPLPTPGGIDYGTGAAQFIQSASLPSRLDSTSVRFDHTASPKLGLFFRFSDTPSSASARVLSVYSPTTSGIQTYTLGATSQLTSNINNEFHLGYTSSNGAIGYSLDNFGGAQPIDLANALGVGTTGTAQLAVLMLFGGNLSAIQFNPQSAEKHQWNLTDSFSLLHGRHALKFGIDDRHLADKFNIGSPGVQYIYTSSSQVLSNRALSATALLNLSNIRPTYHEFSAFAQDEWHLQPRLSLSIGLRWDVNPPPGASDGNIPYTLAGNLNDPATVSLAPKGTPLWRTTWGNVAPRLGIAWTANPSAKYQTVVRAGGGVFFDTGNQTASEGYGGPGSYAFQAVPNAPAPFPGGINFSLSTAPPYTSTSVYAFYPHLQLPFALEWSAALEQALGQSQTLTISYVASNGRRLLQENQFSIHALNPNFGTIITFTNGPTSNYQSLQTKFQRSVARGVQAVASYTWSHALDYGSNFLTIPLMRGNADFDVRNNFSGGITWELPDANKGHVMNTVLNGWAADGHLISRSGFPVNIAGTTSVNPSTGTLYYNGVNLIPNQPIYLFMKGLPGGREINKGAFAAPTTGAIGNAPRNFVRGFGATQLNLAMRKTFPLTDRVSLQFRAESFNILNHPTFGTITSTLTSSTFGQATKTLNQSLGTTSSLYQMGGPRSMQFALKLQF